MKVIAWMSEKKVLAELSPEDMAGIAGLAQYKLMDSLPGGCMSYSGFKPSIVGKTIEPGKIFNEAVAALGIVAKAQNATKQLQDAANTALRFFGGTPEE
jgi:hypothetical protein